MSITKWFREEFRKDKRRFRKHPQIYSVLYLSIGLGVILFMLGLVLLNHPSSPGYVYAIPYDTGFWLFIVGSFWFFGNCIVGVLFDRLVDLELERETE
jgi:hypothetical protein